MQNLKSREFILASKKQIKKMHGPKVYKLDSLCIPYTLSEQPISVVRQVGD